MSVPVFPLVGTVCALRPWTLDDLPDLVAHANNHNISKQLRDVFPHPYSADDGRAFITGAAAESPPTALAIVVDGRASGGVGLLLQSGNERHAAEVGYWLGESLWGRGIGPDAVTLMRRYAVETFGLARLQAYAVATNLRSCRTLEKAGFALEGRTRKSFLKNGVMYDQCCYAWVAE